MMINACMLPRVICEQCRGLCHKDNLKMKNYGDLVHFVCTYTSDYFPIYDDEYGHVHYDDHHHHASHDTQGSADLRTLL